MNTLKLTGVYQLIVGAGIIGIWIIQFLFGEIPEIQTAPYSIVMHMLAETFTGLMLLFSGAAILLNRNKQTVLFYISSGALLYTLLASPGYFMQQNEWGVATLFLALLVLTTGLLLKFR